MADDITTQSHSDTARALLANAELIFDAAEVQAAVDQVADKLNQRFDRKDGAPFPLVLGVMGGAVVFSGQLLTRLTFPLEFAAITWCASSTPTCVPNSTMPPFW